MRKLRRLRPSPALVLAFVALFVVLSGAAVALPGKKSVDKNDLKKNVVKSKNIKNNQVKGADVDEASLNLAKNPDLISPNAIALVNSDGTVAEGDGIASGNITHPITGVYCFYNLSFDPS